MTPQTQQRTLIFVVGMHRSGTSALAASLSECGASVGDALLPAQADVNEQGFFEDEHVVALNERVLAALGWTWFAPGTPDEIDWSDAALKVLSEEAGQLVAKGFGEASLQVVKDPRFCITLPLWLSACEQSVVTARVCTIKRPSDAVARSLFKRDAFPVSFGQRLAALYDEHMQANVPADAVSVSYAELLRDPRGCLEFIGSALNVPLQLDETSLSSVVRADLNHAGQGEENSAVADTTVTEAMLNELAAAFVERGITMMEIAEKHSHALEIIAEKDQTLLEVQAKLDRLGADHGQALETLRQRDDQLFSANKQIAELGEAHGYAISVVQERDATIGSLQEELQQAREMQIETKRQLDEASASLERVKGTIGILEFKIQRLKNLPLIGRLFARYFRYE